MDPLRIATRALIAYVYLLFLLRLSGKRAVRHGTTFDFVLALVLGDLVDDAIWREVPLSQFIVATCTLVGTKLLMVRATTRGSVNPRT
jgi:uncharacterized membrane protein YcaP (DUF421 family)